MRNIPTDLLRAFVTIIDLQGYTRAGEQLGRTQPAISLQMKRLQELLNVQLFVKDGGAKLTEAGEIVASYARQMLSLNDAMLLRLQLRPPLQTRLWRITHRRGRANRSTTNGSIRSP